MSSNAQNENNAEHNIEIWKIKRLIKSLEAARGYVFCLSSSSHHATSLSMISNMIDFKDQVIL
jgi:hypothetical protein